MNKIEKELSIIIPHYNSWQYLQELLESIPRKEWVEIIVVDDNSTNFHENIITFENSFPNVTFLRNNLRNKGAGAARNIGLQNATGNWLLFADADDKFEVNFLDEIGKYFETDYDIVYFSPISFISDGQELSTRHLRYKRYITKYTDEQSETNELKLRYLFEPPWSKLIRSKIIRANDIKFEEIMYSNDILFSAKVGYYAKKIRASNSIIYKIRQNEGSLTTFISEKTFLIRFNAWLDYASFLKTKLPKVKFRKLSLSSFQFIVKLFKYNLRISLLIYVIRKSWKQHISIFDKRILNVKELYDSIRRDREISSKISETNIKE
ncbi:glycosyltransferase family 2 protein [Aerococcus sp.]|uniref:glycosyltransferase family 2 protein n=1 Tax=Aerococcus sp. TaxID=1872398 RepID=UPI0028A80465|nr:glycosyltransferase family 2 protein [Aerococcus sp.]